jgi:hypothetical protein
MNPITPRASGSWKLSEGPAEFSDKNGLSGPTSCSMTARISLEGTHDSLFHRLSAPMGMYSMNRT